MLPPPLQDLTLADDPNSISFSSADINSSTSSSSTRSHHHNSSSSSSHALSDASIADLRLLHRLGCGDIGTVYLAELKCADGVTFAAKVMDKKELQGRNKEGRARIEREILQVLDHPFLPRLYAALESPRWSCLLTEFCPGGDLHLLRQRQPGKRFTESTVRFYASEVVVALEYVHMMGIVYRDLKPENVLVRSDGHIMLTDFDLSLKCDASLKTLQILTTDTMAHGDPLPSADTLTTTTGPMSDADYSSDMPPPPFASTSCILPNCIVPSVSCFQYARHKRNKKKKKNKYWSEGRGPKFVAEPLDVRSMSFVGTHEYLAPEIVSGEGHGSPVDWWTLGIFLFELLYGFTPFRGQDNEQTLANIVARALEFPKEPPISAGARDLIAGLLVKDPAKRLACSMGAVAIRQHSFFHGIKWALLRCVSPPYVPPPFVIRDSPEDSCPGTPVEYY